jgi:hypothetical protein
MFESGIGPGVRSDRLGTWALIFFMALFAPSFGYFLPGTSVLIWLLAAACASVTLAGIGFGLVGLFIPEQRRPALHGLLKAAVPTLVGGMVFLIFLAFAYGSWE